MPKLVCEHCGGLGAASSGVLGSTLCVYCRTLEAEKLSAELDHLWRKSAHNCIDAHCPECDGVRDQ